MGTGRCWLVLWAACWAGAVCRAGVLSHPREVERQRRDVERQEDGVDALKRTVDLKMNGTHPPTEDYYMCHSSEVLPSREYIVQMEALATSDRAHHILIYGCAQAHAPQSTWHCGEVCSRGGSKILWAWAKNADPTKVPKDVGFPVGRSEGINQFVMQIHYKDPIPRSEEGDHSGVRLTLTKQRLRYHAGIFLFMSWNFHIPPASMGVHADVSCVYNGETDMHPFAFRVHAHSLGRVISAYHNNGSWSQIGKGNPQWPQAFYPIKEKMVIKPGEHMAARCTYDAPNTQHTVHVGGQHTDEMCNFYMMYYTEASSHQELSITCGGNRFPEDMRALPAGNDVAMPPNPALEEQAADPSAPHVHVHMPSDMSAHENANVHMSGDMSAHEPAPAPEPARDPSTENNNMASSSTKDVHSSRQSVVEAALDWPRLDGVTLGQVAGVAVDSKNIVHIFHRGPRQWDESSFDVYNHITDKDPIAVNTIISIDQSGAVVKQWGANMFYMPHGLHIDADDNVWVTDVGLHQVMKFPVGASQPSLTLGQRLTPGSDDRSFCKPADVTVLSTGEFFVADGYCNHRIMKFSKEGTLIKKWGNATTQVDPHTHFPEPYAFDVPHSVTALEDRGRVCVADRENGRVTCFTYEGVLVKEIHPTEFNRRLFAVSYSRTNGVLYAVDGPDLFSTSRPVHGFMLDPETGLLVNTFTPPEGFKQPHDIAVDRTGEHVYVAEIGPNKIWKFNVHLDKLSVLLQHRSVKKPGVSFVKRPSSTGTENDTEAEKQLTHAQDGSKDMSASFVIGALLIVPVVIIVIATIYVRVKKTANKKGSYKKDGALLDSGSSSDSTSSSSSSSDSSSSDSEDDLYARKMYEKHGAKKQGNLHSLPFTADTKTDASI